MSSNHYTLTPRSKILLTKILTSNNIDEFDDDDDDNDDMITLLLNGVMFLHVFLLLFHFCPRLCLWIPPYCVCRCLPFILIFIWSSIM